MQYEEDNVRENLNWGSSGVAQEQLQAIKIFNYQQSDEMTYVDYGTNSVMVSESATAHGTMGEIFPSPKC